jgi:phosphatidylinositol alpha-1,6-mannosyltransferase
MRLVITSEIRFRRTPDGRVWTVTSGAYPFWARYLTWFDRLRVVARVLDVDAVPADALRVDGEGVELWQVPYYVGPLAYLRRLPAVRRAVRRAAGPDDVVILRVPSAIGTLLAADRRRQGLPFAVEVVGDPYDVLAPGVVDHLLRAPMRRRVVANLRRQCRAAVGVAYVTERALQERYPPGPGAVTANFSCIEMTDESYVDEPRPVVERPTYRLVSVGSLEQLYKGIDTLIGAVALLARAGTPVHLTHVGDGRYRAELERLADRLGVADRVTFAGALPAGVAVRSSLDGADLFVMPSRTEGMPRAMIEAMARGLPAIATDVGGISELVGPDFLVPPDDEPRLAAAIGALLADPDRRRVAAAANLRRARDYAADVLMRRRNGWYPALRTRPAVPRQVARSRRLRMSRQDRQG